MFNFYNYLKNEILNISAESQYISNCISAPKYFLDKENKFESSVNYLYVFLTVPKRIYFVV